MTAAPTSATDERIRQLEKWLTLKDREDTVGVKGGTILALIARIHQEREKAGWQPIETAPKDGTKVDLWVFWPEGSESRRSTDCYWVSGNNEWSFGQWSESSYVHRPVITHWQPLPTPPALTQEERT